MKITFTKKHKDTTAALGKTTTTMTRKSLLFRKKQQLLCHPHGEATERTEEFDFYGDDLDCSVHSAATASTSLSSMTFRTGSSSGSSLLSLSSHSSGAATSTTKTTSRRFKKRVRFHKMESVFAPEQQVSSELPQDTDEEPEQDSLWYNAADIATFKQNDAFTRKMVLGASAAYAETLRQAVAEGASPPNKLMTLEEEDRLFQDIVDQDLEQTSIQHRLTEQVQLWNPARVGLERAVLRSGKSSSGGRKTKSPEAQRRAILQLWQAFYAEQKQHNHKLSTLMNMQDEMEMIRLGLECQAISRSSRLFALRLALAQRREQKEQ